MRTYPKRLLTVVMVLAMLVSILAVPGMAAETDNTLTVGNEGGLTLPEALNQAASMTGDVTVEIYGQVTLNTSLSGSYDSIKFVGKDADAEIYLDITGYITATGKKVAFEGLTLSKSEGGFIDNAGFMNVAFGIYDVTEVTYTNCNFANGAYASSGKVTYTGCSFKRSHDKYGLWAYGDVDATVDNCTFADYRGIKMYAEGKLKTTNLTVKNSNFSAVTDKPAIVLTCGKSVTLTNNTYSNTGVFELDLDGVPNGTPVTSDVAPSCVNDNGACGVLVDGKIYTTVAQAAAVVTSGSTVILLHDSAETVALTEGVSLVKNGYTASGVTATNPVAIVNGDSYASLSAAIAAANGQPVELLSDVTVDNVQIVTTAPLILNGNNHTVTFTHEKPLRLNADATFNNVTLKNANGRAIELRKGGITVNLNNSTVEVTKSNAQALTVGGNGEGGTVTVNISNSTISAPNGYGIITFNPVNLTLTNASASTGYGALYMKGVDDSKGSAGSVVNINGSTLSSTNNSSEDTNEFGTIILETGNITVNVDASSTVSANANGDCSQWVVLLNNYYADDVQGNQVTFSATPTLGGETKNAALVGSLIDNNNTIQFPYSKAIMTQLQKEGYDPTSNGTTITVYPKHDHEMTKHDAVPATCREDGNVEYYTCDICQKHFFKLEDGSYDECGVNDVITSTSTHLKPIEVPAKAPTCTEDGNIKYYHCDACDENYIISEIGLQIPADETMIVDPATGHKLTAVAAKAPTCTEDGVNAHYTCSGCDLLFNDPKGLSTITKQQATAKAAGHKAVMGVEGKLPTCTEPGNIEYVECSCGALFTDAECKNPITAAETVIPTVAHKLTKTPAVAATCTTAGNTEYYTCETCKALFADAEGKTGTTAEKVVITATGHALTKVAAVAATCTTAGNTEYYTCANCKALFADAEGKTATNAEKVTVAATGHKLTKVEAVAPTYTADGSAEHYACACGALFADAEGKTATTKEALILPQLIEIKESTAEVSTGAVDTAIKEAETTGSVTIDLVEVADEEAAKPEDGTETKPEPAPVVSSAALPVTSLEKVAEISEEATLTLNMTEVTVTMDAKTMAAVAEQSAGATVTLKVEKIETKALTEEQQAVIEDKAVAVVVSATLISNNVAISDFNGGEVTIALPFTLPEGTEGSDFQVYYVADDGTMTAHETEYKNGCLVFSTTHFSDYVVVNTAAPADPTVPNTGDNADLMLYTTALMIALTGLAALFISKKKFSF